MRLGISPENFINKKGEAIPFENGMIYDVEQIKEHNVCPDCHAPNRRITGYYFY